MYDTKRKKWVKLLILNRTNESSEWCFTKEDDRQIQAERAYIYRYELPQGGWITAINFVQWSDVSVHVLYSDMRCKNHPIQWHLDGRTIDRYLQMTWYCQRQLQLPPNMRRFETKLLQFDTKKKKKYNQGQARTLFWCYSVRNVYNEKGVYAYWVRNGFTSLQFPCDWHQ